MAIATLTIDLVARLAKLEEGLNRATALTDKTAKKMDEAFAAAGRSIQASIGGLTAGLTFDYLVADVARLQAEIDKFATLTGTSTQDFQRFAYAAKTVGIEQDKLADILKDVNDKVGDFLSTGGGEMKDFFENIAPAVGVTADKFRNLSGPAALQLYFDSLQKANVSQSEMTFYMEALANDATLLAPLLKNNGEAIKRLGDEAERFGKVMSDEAIAAGKEFEREMAKLSGTLDGLRITIGTSVIPEIERLLGEFNEGIKIAGGFWSALSTFGTSGFGDPGKDARQYRKELEALNRDLAAITEWEKQAGVGADYEKRIADTKKRLAFAEYRERELALAGNPADNMDPRDRAARAPVAFSGTFRAPATAKPKGGRSAAAAKPDLNLGEDTEAARAYAAMMEAVARAQRAADDVGRDLTSSQRALYDLMRSPEWERMPQPWRDVTVAQTAAATEAERAAEDLRRLNELLAATDSSQLERTRADMQLLADAFQRNAITAAEFEEAATKALGNVAQQGADEFETLLRAIEGWGRDASEEIARVVMSGELSLKSLGDILDRVTQQIMAMAIQKQLMDPIIGAASDVLGLGGKGGGGSGGAAGSTALGDLLGKAAGGAKELLGQMSGESGLGDVFGKLMATLPSFDVGTDFVPRDMIAKIHKGERIVPAAEAARERGSGGDTRTMQQTINFHAAGPIDRRTQQQLGFVAGRAAQRALIRNG